MGSENAGLRGRIQYKYVKTRSIQGMYMYIYIICFESIS